MDFMHEPTRPVLLADLSAGLVWPKLLRAVPLAAHPGRILLGAVPFIWLMAVGSLFDLIAGRPINWPPPPQSESLLDPGPGAASQISPTRSLGAFEALAISDKQAELAGVPKPDIFDQAPSHAWPLLIALLLIVVPIFLLFQAAIARSVACDVALRLNLSSSKALRSSARKLPSILGAWFGPLIIASVLVLMLLTAGLLLRWPGLNILGGALYGLFLLLGALLVFIALGFLLAQSLLAPAVVIENSDAIDAVQRAYAYLLCRPARFVVYAAILIAQGIISIVVAAFLLHVTLEWTASLTGAWSQGPILARPDPTGSTAIAASLAGLWRTVFIAILGGFILSFYATGSTLLYLTLRRINDDQDIEDIWVPDAASTPAG